MITLKDLEEKDGLYFVGHIADIDGDGWVSEKEARSIVASINKDLIPDDVMLWADGPWQYEDYEVRGGYYVRSELKDFFKKIFETGHQPVGIKVDMNSYNLEVIVKEK